MNKETLREQLFQQYFDVKDGVLATDLVDKLSFIPETWEKLHVLCEKNIAYFDSFSTLEKIKMLKYKQKNYLILKIRMFQYVIIDVDRMENVTEERVRCEFDKDFFVNLFW